MSLSLRSRLLLAVAVIAVVQVVAALAVISITGDQILDQVDDRLDDAAEIAEGAGQQRVPQLDDLYQGVLSADGSLATLNPVIDRGNRVPPPTLAGLDIETADAGPFTVDAEQGEEEYRVRMVPTNDGAMFVVAGLLDGYEWTINRLIRAIAMATAAVGLVLAAVSWWVLRLGIAPIKRMTLTAEAIAAGDLSERIVDAPRGTEAGQLADALNTMMGQIESSFGEREEAEARLRRFVADASHELRTPVATIRGYAELYEAGGLTEPSALDDAMHRTREESERMSRLIADLLHLAKLDREPVVESRLVALDVVAAEVVADASVAHPSRIIRLEGPPESTLVRGDPDLLRRALVNLVDNAVLHTDPDSATTVTLAEETTAAVVRVSDTGGGMDPEVAARATERFFRADPSRSRHQGGSGLGLAIVEGIVEAHGGRLHIESIVGEGTTISMRFPIDPATGDSQPTHC